MTLYNRCALVGPDGRTRVTWHRRVLDACTWRARTHVVRDEKALSQAHEIICRIPADTDYLPYDAWACLTQRAGKFTLSVGDVLVLGCVPDEIGGASSAGDIVKKYRARGAMQVAFASDNASGMLGHYLAKGD
ncbi:MAG: hypothetical protein RSD95_06795 [Clostridia bacterium]